MDGPRFSEDPNPSPVCRAFLRKLAQTSDKARRQHILTACAKVPQPWAEELLWESLADPNEAVRDAVVRHLCARPTLHPALAEKRLRMPPWYARSSALSVVGRRRIREVLAGIGKAAGDANADVRKAAAEALGEIGGEEAVRLLVRLKKDDNPHVRAAAEEAIVKTSALRFS